MSDDLIEDESSHYEVSLTAGQAFIAFVLLLLSLAAAFAFGLVIGRGQQTDRPLVQREPEIVREGSAPIEETTIIELEGEEAPLPSPETRPVVLEETPPAIAEERGADAPPAAVETPAPARAETAPAPSPAAASGPAYAQVLSSTEMERAESLAARLIESGFDTAYVERVISSDNIIYRVRVRFPSEADARAAADRLREITRSDPWITRQ